ncbi:MAG: YncE family protein [Chloroflexi bacterium]|nr:YncE family protein [Chloroflexota bacterium]
MFNQLGTALPRSPNMRMLGGLLLAIFACLGCMLASYIAIGPQPAATVAPSSATPAALDSETPSPTSTDTPAPTATSTPSPSPTTTPTGTQPPTATTTATPTVTPTATRTPTRTPTSTWTPTTVPTALPYLRGPQNLAVYAKTGNVWVTNRTDNSLAEVDGGNVSRVLTRIANVPSPNGIAIYQAAGLAYVTNRDQSTVTEIDLNRKQVRQTFAVGSLPWGIAVDESHGAVYVANFGSNSYSCIRPATRDVLAIASKITQPAHVTYNARVDAIYGVSRDGQVVQLTCGSSQIVKSFADSTLFDIASSENSNHVFVTTNGSQRVQWFFVGSMGANSYPFANEPYAVEAIKTCVGAVVPAEDKLYVLDQWLSGVVRTFNLGKQTVGEGGQGLAYFAPADTVYVANFGANSLTAIKNPCPPNVTPVYGTPKP